MDEQEYGTSREAVVRLIDANGEEVTIKVPNARENLSSDSAVVTTLVNQIMSTPETSDDFQLFLVNNNGQAAPPAKVEIDVITTTKVKIV